MSGRVRIATTMWHKVVNLELAERRETELGNVAGLGESCIKRFEVTRNSALDILNPLVQDDVVKRVPLPPVLFDRSEDPNSGISVLR